MSAPTGMHRGARIEDAVKGRIAVVLRRFGWLPLAVPYTGYGSAPTEREGWVRVLMRVKLSSPNTSAEESEGSGGRWWRKFFTVGLAGIPVVVRVATGCTRSAVDAAVTSTWSWRVIFRPVARGAGRAGGRTPTAEQVRVVGPDEQFG